MPGRVEIDDVAPVVSCGAYPAKAVVDEVVPVRAAVWREGHDAVAATLVVRYLGPRYPQIGETRRLKAPAAAEPTVERAVRVKPLHVPMSPDDMEPYVFHGAFTPDRVGLWTYRVDGWGDPIHTWRHAVEAKLNAGQGESEMSNDLLVGAQLMERAAAGVPRARRDPLLKAADALRTPGDPVTRAALALTTEIDDVLAHSDHEIERTASEPRPEHAIIAQHLVEGAVELQRDLACLDLFHQVVDHDALGAELIAPVRAASRPDVAPHRRDPEWSRLRRDLTPRS